MQYDINGTIAPCVRFDPSAGETAWVSSGGLMSYTDGIAWQIKVPGGAGGAVRRMLAGEGAGLTFVTAERDAGRFTVTASEPGRIVPWSLDEDGPVVTTRGAFLAAWGADVDIDVTIARRAGAAIFGGAGLLLQKISGRGSALVHVSGDLDERTLGPGETLTVSTGNLAAFSRDVDYDIVAVGSVGKFFFGGEGLFMTKLTGPQHGQGRVLLQTLKRGVTVATKG
ncbi:MAG: AIM24 family protein [Planctomycetota bacterium]